MKICVVGAGAIGGQIAAKLAAGGADVSVLARGAHLDAIRSRGLTIVQSGEVHTVRLRAADDAAGFGPQDAVFVAVKAQMLPTVAASIVPMLHDDTPVVFVVNGLPWWYFHRAGGPFDGRQIEELDPGAALWNTIGQRAVGAVVYAAAAIEAPGRIRAVSPQQHLFIGEPGGGRSGRIAGIVAALERGGYAARISERIRDDIWTKLIGNIAGNLTATLTASTLSQAFADAPCRGIGVKLIGECSEIAVRLGCTPRVNADRMVAQFASIDHRPSTLQDIEHGRAIEFDAMFGVPLRLAKDMQIATPTLDVLTALLRQRANAALQQGA